MNWLSIYADPLTRLGWAALGVLTGFWFFLECINRLLMNVQSPRIKPLIFRSGFFIAITAGMLAGWYYSPQHYPVFPLAILTLLIALEIWTHIHSAHARGTGPVETQHSRMALHQPITTNALRILRYELPCAAWHGPAFRVAHISDLHVDFRLPDAYYDKVIAELDAARPDMVFITGDFVTKEHEPLHLPGLLAKIHARLGVFAIRGNHDFWVNPGQVAKTLAAAGITLLDNRVTRVSIAPGAEIIIGGSEGPWDRQPPWQPPANRHNELLLVLTHTADNIYRLSKAGATAVFSGHYHAGQFRVPGMGALVIPSLHGRRFTQGHFEINQTHLFVSAGIGVTGFPLRLYCQPDILLVDFLPAGGNTPAC